MGAFFMVMKKPRGRNSKKGTLSFHLYRPHGFRYLIFVFSISRWRIERSFSVIA